MKKTVKKRAFISAIAMLIVSAIVLTSSTFAWFSMSKEVEVSSMNLNITTADGISISANTHKFGTSLTKDEITPAAGSEGQGLAADADHTNAIPELLSPVSSTLGLVNGYPVFFKGSINDNKKLITTKVTNEKEGGFVVFDIFVQVSEEKDVKLYGSSIGAEDSVKAALRMGVINCGSADYSVKDEAKEITTRSQSSVSLWIVDGNKNDETKYLSSSFGGGSLNPTDTTNPVITNDYTDDTKAEKICTATDASGLTFRAQKGVNRVRIYLWVEGNDIDCKNDIAGSSLTFELKLGID